MPQLLQLVLRIFLQRWIEQQVARGDARPLQRPEQAPTDAVPPLPAPREWRPTFRDGLFDVGGFDAQLALAAPIRAQKRLLWITWGAVLASTMFGLGAGATVWLAFDSQLLSGAAFLLGAGFLMNLLRLLNAGARKAPGRPLPQWWRIGFGPFFIVGALAFFVGQPLLVVASARLPGGSLEETRAALVALHQRELNERHTATIVKLQTEISELELELAVQQEEFHKIGTNPDRSYGPAYLEMVYRDRELKGRIVYLRERLDALEVAGPPNAKLEAFGEHIRASTLLAHRLAFVWSHPTFALPWSVLFVALCTTSLALRWLFLRGVNEYLDQRWLLDHQLVDRHVRLTHLAADRMLRPWGIAPRPRIAPSLATTDLLARIPKADARA